MGLVNFNPLLFLCFKQNTGKRHWDLDPDRSGCNWQDVEADLQFTKNRRSACDIPTQTWNAICLQAN